MSENLVVDARNVTVRFGRTLALEGVTLQASPGATGLLGPNGAGKSTLIKVVLGLLAPDAGEVKVLGRSVSGDTRPIRQRVGYMPEHDGYIPGLSGVRFVAYMGELAGLSGREAMARAHEVLFYVGLHEARYRPIETYSTGMKQRVKLAQALIHDPAVVFLDEPTNGLDPKGRHEMLQLVEDIATRKGISVILCSHLLPDVEQVCRDVVVMREGRVVRSGAIRDLTLPTTRRFEVRIKGSAEKFRSAATSRAVVFMEEDASIEGGLFTVEVPDGSTAPIFSAATESGVQVRHLIRHRPSLDEVFRAAITS